MVVKGLIDISFTALIGKMVTVAFVGDIPDFRLLSLKKLRYVLKRYRPDAFVIYISGKPEDNLYDILDIYRPVYLFSYDLGLLNEYLDVIDGGIWFIPSDVKLLDLGENIFFRVEEGVFQKFRKWFIGKEKRVEVVSSTLGNIFENRDGVLYRKFWL